MTVTKFEEMNLSRDIMRAIERQGFKEATTIQAETIPAMMEWRDVMAKAPTGLEKRLLSPFRCWSISIFRTRGVQALVLSPTRELALQICDEIRKLAAFMPRVKVLAVYGGQNIELQMRGLKGRRRSLWRRRGG